jgi:hypothetical protein
MRAYLYSEFIGVFFRVVSTTGLGQDIGTCVVHTTQRERVEERDTMDGRCGFIFFFTGYHLHIGFGVRIGSSDHTWKVYRGELHHIFTAFFWGGMVGLGKGAYPEG